MKNKQFMLSAIIITLVALLLISGCSRTKDVSALLQEGQSKLEAQDYYGAIDEFKKAVKYDDKSIDAYRGLAASYAAVMQNENSSKYADRLIKTYESLKLLSALSDEEYINLAKLYEYTGEKLKQRNILEEANRLYPDINKLEILSTIVIEAEKDDEKVIAKIKKLNEFLSSEDDTGVISLLLSEDWYGALIPKIREGRRLYNYEPDSQNVIKLVVSVNNSGQRETILWYLRPEGNLTFYKVSQSFVTKGITVLSGDTYNGAYSLIFCDALYGSIYEDSGTFSSDIVTGSITSSAALNMGSSDVLTLWGAKDSLTKTSYAGSFGADGRTQVAQSPGAGGIIYAYDAAQNNYLYITDSISTDAGSYIFTCDTFNFVKYPQW